MYNFFIFTTYYLLILTSIVGYGLCFLKLLKIKFDFINFGYAGLFGIYILIVYSYFSNLFIAHTDTDILLALYWINFIYILNKTKISLYKSEIIFSFIVFVLLFLLYFSLKIMMIFHIIIFLILIILHNKVYI